jgi:molybdopterin synthase sulfur carrier subunit
MIEVRLRLFAAAREAAGCAHDTFDVASGTTVDTLLANAVDRYGPGFSDVLSVSRVWVNGDESPAGAAHTLSDGDELAVLPPVSGGA